VIHFSGHNHFTFDEDQNIYDDSYVSIHVPTLGSNTNPDGGSNENPDTSDRVALGSFASFVLAILTAVGVVTFRRKKRI